GRGRISRIEDRPRTEGPLPRRRAVGMGRDEAGVVAIRLDLVVPQVEQVLELAPGEERIPRQDVDDERDRDEADDADGEVRGERDTGRRARTPWDVECSQTQAQE